MSTTLVFNFISVDKPGIVERISNTVSEHGGNWLESRMSQLAGHFTGITRVQTDRDRIEILRQALTSLNNDDLTITILPDLSSPIQLADRQLQLTLIGGDRPGIVRELTRALAARNINVIEMDTNVTSAPMTAEPLFQATATISVPSSQDMNELSDTFDEIANDLAVDINMED
ncbi:MAG: ACT domain-containing protein [Spongiibacteraceae bacterium]